MADASTYTAIIGAGMAGAACAHRLTRAGHAVKLFDKGRSVGGRLAQRRVGGGIFDHGAQYIAVRDPAMEEAASGWRAEGAVQPWPGVTAGDGGPVVVGVPGMSAPVKVMLGGLVIAMGRRIAALRRDREGWMLAGAGRAEEGPFARVVLAVPASDAASLLETAAGTHSLREALAPVRIEPCWAGMIAFGERFRPDWTGARVTDEALAWSARNRSKPHRGEVETWTVHARPDWSSAHLEEHPQEVARLLAAALARVAGTAPEPTHLSAHRWRHALVTRPVGEPCLYDPALRIGLCGDWCLGPRVESAYLSGLALAERMAGE